MERLNKAKFGYFKSESFIIDHLKEANLYIDGVRCAVAYVVEAADDISMVISDFEDGVKKGCINIRDVERYRKQRKPTVTDFRGRFSNYYQKNVGLHSEEPMIATSIRLLNSLRNDLIKDAAESFVNMIMAWDAPFPAPVAHRPAFAQPLIEQSPQYPIVKMLKGLVSAKVYQDEQIVIPELHGQTVLTALLDKTVRSLLGLSVGELSSSDAKKTPMKVAKLVSKNYIDGFIKENSGKNDSFDSDEKREIYLKLRLAVDNVAGMTDSYAEQLYSKLF